MIKQITVFAFSLGFVILMFLVAYVTIILLFHYLVNESRKDVLHLEKVVYVSHTDLTNECFANKEF